MLDRGDLGAVAVAKDGAQRYARHPALVCSDLGAVGVAVGKEETSPVSPSAGTR